MPFPNGLFWPSLTMKSSMGNEPLCKMPGDDWQKFANLRLLYSYMICHPGKKLLFMGAELGQWNEWNCKDEILGSFSSMTGIDSSIIFLRRSTIFIKKISPLWENDFDRSGFEWIDFSRCANCTICYLRKGGKNLLLRPQLHAKFCFRLFHRFANMWHRSKKF